MGGRGEEYPRSTHFLSPTTPTLTKTTKIREVLQARPEERLLFLVRLFFLISPPFLSSRLQVSLRSPFLALASLLVLFCSLRIFGDSSRHQSGQVSWVEFVKLFELVGDETGSGGIAALPADMKEVHICETSRPLVHSSTLAS